MTQDIPKDSGYLSGQCLIAMPGMGDPRFEHSVIYLCAHTAEGAMGIVVNRVIEQVTFSELLKQLEILPDQSNDETKVHFGGPVETARGFVLHTSDYVRSATMLINPTYAMTATVDILRDIAEGSGPKHSILALGYAGWSPGQLDEEIKENVWLTVPADRKILFDESTEDKWAYALKKLGIDPNQLSSTVGTA